MAARRAHREAGRVCGGIEEGSRGDLERVGWTQD